MSVDAAALRSSRLPRLDAVVVSAVVLSAAAIGWAATIDSAAEMGNGPGTMGQRLGTFVVFWVLMMAGMMLPTVARTTEEMGYGTCSLAVPVQDASGDVVASLALVTRTGRRDLAKFLPALRVASASITRRMGV